MRLLLAFLAAPLALAAQTSITPTLTPLETGVSSLGAAVCDNSLYVYGGHAGKTHAYDTSTARGTLQRLSLAGKPGEAKWEALPGGPPLQGLGLVAHGGFLYRVGGMTPVNEPGKPADLRSTRDAARFDPKSKTWADLPPMPAGRSSHDLVAVGDKLVVVGGWTMRGDKPSEWCDTALVLDLKAVPFAWKSVPQPFKRRALTAAAIGDKVYAIGGLDADGKAQSRVDVLDPATNAWSAGPELPGKEMGFSPAATVADGSLIVSTADGQLHRLNDKGTAFEPAGQSTTKRRVHRIVPYGKGVALVGGASAGKNATDLEIVTLHRADQ